MVTSPNRIATAVQATYPSLPPEQCLSLAVQLTRIIDQAITEGGGAIRIGGRATRRTELGSTLKRLRDAVGLKQHEVARLTEWSAAKLSRIETGDVGVSITDLKFLLQLYGVTDRAVIQRLHDLARISRQQGPRAQQ